MGAEGWAMTEAKKVPSSGSSKKARPSAPVYKPPAGACRPLNHWRIEIKKENGSEWELIGKYNVSKKSHFLFGRHESCDIQGAHLSLSRHQCALVYMPDGFVLIDLKSAHGTFKNGERLSANEQTSIESGDYITLGKSTRRYYLQWVDDSDAPPPPKRVKTADGGVQVEQVTQRKKLSDAEIAKLKAKASGRGRGVSQLRRAMGTHFDAKKSLIIQPSLLAPEGKPMPAPGEEQDEEPEKEVAPRPARNTVTGISTGLRKEEVEYSDDSDSD